MKLYYFDNSATSYPKPNDVNDVIKNSVDIINANPGRAGHRNATELGKKIYSARETVAKFFNVRNPLNVAFTQNATESLNFAIKGAIPDNSHVITTNFEHNSVLRPLFYLQDEKNVVLTFINTFDEIERNITKETRAVVINHTSNVNGTIQDIEYIGKICKKHNILFILDASQSAGYLDINMERDNIDILCVTGHKSLFGLQGIGAICIKDGVSISPILEGGTGSFSKLQRQPLVMPEMLESGTPNSLGILSLEAGINFINKIGIENIKKHKDELVNIFLDGIKKYEKLTIYKSLTENQAPVISVNIDGIPSNDLSEILDEEFGILVRGGFHCAPRTHDIMGTSENGAVRFSFSYFNTEEDIKFIISAIEKIINS